MALPAPLDLNRVIPDKGLCAAVSAVFDILDPAGKPGGITVGLPGETRALVYVGPCPVKTDNVVRAILKPGGFNVSAVRDENELFDWETATQADPKKY